MSATRRRNRNLFAQQSVAALPRTHRALCAGACRRIARPEHQGGGSVQRREHPSAAAEDQAARFRIRCEDVARLRLAARASSIARATSRCAAARSFRAYRAISASTASPATTPASSNSRHSPTGQFDGVISTDVLEHCPEPDLPWILDEMFGAARKFIFANIARLSRRQEIAERRKRALHRAAAGMVERNHRADRRPASGRVRAL